MAIARRAAFALAASVIGAGADATFALTKLPQLVAGVIVAASFVAAGYAASRESEGASREVVIAGGIGAAAYAVLTFVWITFAKRAPAASAVVAAAISFALGGAAFAAGVRLGFRRG
jgi:hypothetical protein